MMNYERIQHQHHHHEEPIPHDDETCHFDFLPSSARQTTTSSPLPLSSGSSSNNDKGSRSIRTTTRKRSRNNKQLSSVSQDDRLSSLSSIQHLDSSRRQTAAAAAAEQNCPSNGHFPTRTSDSDCDYSTVDNDGDGIFVDLRPQNHESMDTARRTTKNTRKKYWAAALYATTTVLLFADQNLMSPNLTAIAKEFGFSDLERDQKLGGDIALAFFMLGAPASILVGCWADTSFYRSALFALVVAMGEGACVMTYFSRTYAQLYACRAVTGLSLGGALPLISSVLGDLFMAEERHVVNAVVLMGMGFGVAIGQGIAGLLGPTYGWRIPFLVVGVPALICAALVFCTVKDPERGASERAILLLRQESSSSIISCEEYRSQKDEGSRAVQMVPVTEDQNSNSSFIATGHRYHTVVKDDEAQPEGSIATGTAGLEESNDAFRDDGEHAMCPTATDEGVNWSHFPGKSDGLYVDAVHNNPSEKSRSLMTHWYAFRQLMRTPTLVLLLLQGGPGCLPWGIINTYLNDYLAEEKGMSVEAATLVVLCFGLGTSAGMFTSGATARYLYQIRPKYPAILSGSMAIIACFPLWMVLNTMDSSSSSFYIISLSVVAGMTAGATGPIVKATLQNVTSPQSRGQATAIFNLADDFGKGGGPVFVAYLIKEMNGDRTKAFNYGVLGWMACGAFNLGTYLTVERDEDNVQWILQQQQQQQPQQQQLEQHDFHGIQNTGHDPI